MHKAFFKKTAFCCSKFCFFSAFVDILIYTNFVNSQIASKVKLFPLFLPLIFQALLSPLSEKLSVRYKPSSISCHPISPILYALPSFPGDFLHVLKVTLNIRACLLSITRHIENCHLCVSKWKAFIWHETR